MTQCGCNVVLPMQAVSRAQSGGREGGKHSDAGGYFSRWGVLSVSAPVKLNTCYSAAAMEDKK